MHKRRSTNLGCRPTSKSRLSDTSALSLSVNHVYTTKTLEKELGKEQKTLYIMLLKWLKKLPTLCWNITMTKDFLADLTVEWHPPPTPGMSSINKLGLNYETYIRHKNLLPTPDNLRLRPDISWGPVVIIVTISFTIISHILYRPVSHLQKICNLICNLY